MKMLKGMHKHHIVPKYQGGSNHPDNLVLLEPIDHAIAHLVRYKIYGNPADAWAYNRLVSSFDDMGIPKLRNFERPYLCGVPKSAEHKEKISKAHMGRKKAPEAIEKRRITITGRRASESQLKCLASGRLLNNTPEARKKRSASMMGRDISAWSHKIAEANRGKKMSDQTKEKISVFQKGRKQTPDQIAKRVASRKATLQSQGRTR
jgi:hypothetical protein